MLTSSCSFTTGGAFKECDLDSQCGSVSACSRGYCLPMPAGCRRAEGVFDRSSAVRVAALLPLTSAADGGGIDPVEQNMLNGLILAVREVNGVSSVRFGLYACDTGGVQASTPAGIEWAVGQMHLPALVTSGNALTVTAALNGSRRDAGTVVMSPNATSETLSGLFRADRSTFRTAAPDSVHASVLAQLMTGDPLYIDQNKVAVIAEAGNDREMFADNVRQRLVSLGRDARAFIFQSPVSAPGLVASITMNFAPTASVLIGSPNNIRSILAETSRSPGLRANDGHRWLLSSSAKDPITLSTPVAAAELEGMLGASPAPGQGALATAFRTRFLNAFGTEPLGAASSYDAMYLVMLASTWRSAEGVPVTGPLISQGVFNVSADGGVAVRLTPEDWSLAVTQLAGGRQVTAEGVTGKFELDPNAGAPVTVFEVWRVNDGGFDTVRFVKP